MKKTLITAISAALVFGAAAPSVLAHCGKCGVGEAKKAGEYPDVKIEDLEKMIKDGKVVLIDANGSDSYKEGRIPGALDFKALGADGLKSKLPADKDTPIVAYCGGPACGAYKDAAAAAVALGYTHVHHFSGGISGWKAANKEVEKG